MGGGKTEKENAFLFQKWQSAEQLEARSSCEVDVTC